MSRQPIQTWTVTSTAELLDAIRDRRDDLDVPHAVIGEVAGLADGHVSTLLAPNATKNLGELSLGALLGALALRIARVELTVDEAEAERLIHRWRRRRRRVARKE